MEIDACIYRSNASLPVYPPILIYNPTLLSRFIILVRLDSSQGSLFLGTHSLFPPGETVFDRFRNPSKNVPICVGSSRRKTAETSSTSAPWTIYAPSLVCFGRSGLTLVGTHDNDGSLVRVNPQVLVGVAVALVVAFVVKVQFV